MEIFKLTKRKCCYSAAVFLCMFLLCGNNLHGSNITARDASMEMNQSQEGTIPYGVWNVTQVIDEKNTDGKKIMNNRQSVTEVQSIIPCPQKWEIINSKELIMHFADGKRDTLDYTLKDGQLIIHYLGAIFYYSYNVNNDIITLNATIKSGKMEENLVITSKLQK